MRRKATGKPLRDALGRLFTLYSTIARKRKARDIRDNCKR
jgi:hypothetical protein